MEFDLTSEVVSFDEFGSNVGQSTPVYDDEDRNEIINLIRALESPIEEKTFSPHSSPLAPRSDSLMDDREIAQIYTDDFDAMFSF
jgi:hypothetical protein